MGEDKLGNRFFEVPINKHSQVYNKRPERYVLIKGQTSINQAWHELSGDTPKVNPEWERWLRNKRPNPPTDEELELIERQRQIRIKGGEIFEKKYQQERQKMVEDGLILDKTDEKVEQGTEKSSFPTRQGLESLPGDRIIKND